MGRVDGINLRQLLELRLHRDEIGVGGAGQVEEPLCLEEVLARREFRLELRLKLFHQRHALFEHDGGQPGPLGFQAFKHIGAIHREILHLLDGYLGEVLSRILEVRRRSSPPHEAPPTRFE